MFILSINKLLYSVLLRIYKYVVTTNKHKKHNCNKHNCVVWIVLNTKFNKSLLIYRLKNGLYVENDWKMIGKWLIRG